MNLPPPVTWHGYSTHMEEIARASLQQAQKSREAASEHLHDMHGVKKDDLLDITVTCDGTWSKWGFTAMYGVVVVASWDTGEILDCEVLSKYCHECSTHSNLDQDSIAFQEWWKTHENKCESNYAGSSPAMEMEGALCLWQRSISTLKLRYTTVICDGDSKSSMKKNLMAILLSKNMSVWDMSKSVWVHNCGT